MTPENLGANVGSGALGTLIAWFTLKGKIDKMIVIHNQFTKSTIEFQESMKEVIRELKSQNEQLVRKETCIECKGNNANQVDALHEKLDILLKRS